MADQTQRLEIATVRAENGSNIVYRFANDAAAAGPIPTESGNIQNLKQVVLAIQEDAAEKISISTNIYQTVAEGLAGTPDQAIFLVQSDNAEEIYTVWKNNAGTAVNTGKKAISSEAVLEAVTAAQAAAEDASDSAQIAETLTEGIIPPQSTAPTTRVNGTPLQTGDSYFNTVDQLEYLYKSEGWALRGTDLVFPTTDNDERAFIFADELGMVLLKLMTDGSVDMNGATFQGRNSGGLSVLDPNGFSLARFDGDSSEFSGLYVKSYPRRNGIFFIDDLGFVLGKVASDGVFFGAKPKDVTPSVDALPVAQLGQQVRTDIMQIVGDGQSLSVGETALPAISKTQPFSNVMMASGVRSRYQQMGYNPTLVPLIEQDGVSPMPTNQGETPVSGMANGLVRRLVDRGYAQEDWCFAGMAAGRAGWSIERLSPPPLGTGGVWEDMVNMIRDMKSQADTLNKTYSVWAYSWVQGESNYQVQWVNDQYRYSQYLAQLWDLFTEKVLEITGQTFRPYMFTYQVATHRRYSSDKMEIALSQWALSKIRPDVVMAVPCYQFKCSPDNIHLPNEQSWLMGEYFARAMDFTMVRKTGKWRPLEPVSIDWQGDTIDIKYHVPGGKITIDTALCSQARNQGFDIRDVDDAAIDDAISTVSVVGFDTVRIKLAEAAIDSAFRITYARGIPGDPVSSGAETGARGNVRDTMGDFDKVTSPLGNEFPMHNASVMYQYDRKNGFL